MIVTFCTQKGGVGKTTLAIALSNYISLIDKRFKVHVIDFDFQKSFYYKWKDDEEIGGDYLYEVNILTESEEKDLYDLNVINELKKSKDIYLFDLAGSIHEKYSSLIIYSDFLIIPFSYSDVTLNSTMVFINLCYYLKHEGKMIFIRNNLDKNGVYKNQEEMDVELNTHGLVLKDSVFKRNALLNINTKSLNYNQKEAVKKPFRELMKNIYELIK